MDNNCENKHKQHQAEFGDALYQFLFLLFDEKYLRATQTLSKIFFKSIQTYKLNQMASI